MTLKEERELKKAAKLRSSVLKLCVNMKKCMIHFLIYAE